MKRLLFLALAAIPLCATSQTSGRFITQGSSNRYPGIAADSLLIIPRRDTTIYLPAAQERMGGRFTTRPQDGLLYYHNGTLWTKVGSDGVDTTGLSSRINQRVKYSDTASMLAPYLRSGNAVTTFSFFNTTGITGSVTNATTTPSLSLSITKAGVGLSQVDNTSDANKPVSTAQATADAAVQAYAIQRANHTGTQTLSTISQSGAGIGQVPKWNGTTWAPANDSGSGGASGGIDSVRLHSDSLNEYKGTTPKLVAKTAGFNFTSIAQNDLVKWDTAQKKFVNFSPTYISNVTGLITAGSNVTVSGSGTSGSPYVIASTGGGGGSATADSIRVTGAMPAAGNIYIDSFKRPWLIVRSTSTRYRFALDSTESYAPPSSYDADATAYFSAAGITSTAQKDAFSALETGKKGIALSTGNAWSMQLMDHPYLGPNLAAQAVNAKAPGTHNMTFNGGMTYNATGLVFDGIDDYADPSFVPLTEMSSTGSFTILLSLGSTPTLLDKCVFGTSGDGNFYFYPKLTGGAIDYTAYTTDLTVTPSSTPGRYILTWDGTTLKLFRNGVRINQSISISHAATHSSYKVFYGARSSSNTAADFIDIKVRESAIWDIGMTEAQVASIDALYATYESTLSR